MALRNVGCFFRLVLARQEEILDFREGTKEKVPCQEKVFALRGLSLKQDPDIESLRFDRWPIVLRLIYNRVTLLA